MLWLANWCFVRGQNFLIPHAFYYSIRGPRFDERPPDVGPNAEWWPVYKQFADACRQLSWINTDSRQVCNVAILGEATFLPYKAAKVCYQNQVDFNYLEIRLLADNVTVKKDGIHIAGMVYKAVILDSLSSVPEKVIPVLKKINDSKRLIIRNGSPLSDIYQGAKLFSSPEELKAQLSKLTEPDITLNPVSENIRYRHVIKNGYNYYILFNEEKSMVKTKITTQLKRSAIWFSPYTGKTEIAGSGEQVTFEPYELKVLIINSR
jgi:hypothetical protein